jgi:hypothetical protein
MEVPVNQLYDNYMFCHGVALEVNEMVRDPVTSTMLRILTPSAKPFVCNAHVGVWQQFAKNMGHIAATV